MCNAALFWFLNMAMCGMPLSSPTGSQNCHIHEARCGRRRGQIRFVGCKKAESASSAEDPAAVNFGGNGIGNSHPGACGTALDVDSVLLSVKLAACTRFLPPLSCIRSTPALLNPTRQLAEKNNCRHRRGTMQHASAADTLQRLLWRQHSRSPARNLPQPHTSTRVPKNLAANRFRGFVPFTVWRGQNRGFCFCIHI